MLDKDVSVDDKKIQSPGKHHHSANAPRTDTNKIYQVPVESDTLQCHQYTVTCMPHEKLPPSGN